VFYRIFVLAAALLAVLGVAAGAATSPRAQARVSLLRCESAMAAAHFGPVTTGTIAKEKQLVARAVSACGTDATLQTFAMAAPGDQALFAAANAEFLVADGLATYEKYLGVRPCQAQCRRSLILKRALAQIKQATPLLAQALAELN
jgi:hypothetical protein